MIDVEHEIRWRERLAEDRRRVGALQPAFRRVVEEVVRREVAAGADAVALTGSTVRGRRTANSDLDFHIVGASSPESERFEMEIDVVSDSWDRFKRRFEEGDDFVQWTVRHGWVLHDPARVFRDARARIANERLWPDPRRKFERADALVSLAERVLRIEDLDAAQEHLRAAMTSLARGLLLREGAFPLARDELAEQLAGIGRAEVGTWLHRSIHERLDGDELAAALGTARIAERAAVSIPEPASSGRLSAA